MKKYFTLYLAFGLMTICAVFFMHTLLKAAVYAPQGGGPQVNSTQEIIPDIATTTTTTTATSDVPMLLSTAALAKYPSRLIIPSLHIDAHVQMTGVNVNGNMGTPNNFTDVAWYKYGTTPGKVGSAVIDGHVDNGLALAGVFKHLVDIQTGADVYITTIGGVNLHFVVSSINMYDYKSAPVKDIFSDQGVAQIRLVTCGGTWVPSDRTYDKRVVVTATLVK